MQAETGKSKVTKPMSTGRKLPLSRVKKIAKMDEDVTNLSNAAAIIISGATEMFASYFAEQSFFFSLAEKKKGLHYKHCAAAVARLPQLDFLSDVVPQISKPADSIRKKTTLAKQNSKADSTVPDWALPHPEILSRIRAAQETRAAEEVAQDKVEIGSAANTHAEPSDMDGSTNIDPRPQSSSQVEAEDVEMQNAM